MREILKAAKYRAVAWINVSDPSQPLKRLGWNIGGSRGDEVQKSLFTAATEPQHNFCAGHCRLRRQQQHQRGLGHSQSCLGISDRVSVNHADLNCQRRDQPERYLDLHLHHYHRGFDRQVHHRDGASLHIRYRKYSGQFDQHHSHLHRTKQSSGSNEIPSASGNHHRDFRSGHQEKRYRDIDSGFRHCGYSYPPPPQPFLPANSRTSASILQTICRARASLSS